MTIPATPLTAEELAAFLRDPGDAWEETKLSTNVWLQGIAATIAAMDAENERLRKALTQLLAVAADWETVTDGKQFKLEHSEAACAAKSALAPAAKEGSRES